MHYLLPKLFSFIDDFDKNHISKLDKKVAIIYRNYSIIYDKKLILQIKNFCKKKGHKFFIANNLKLSISLDLDGVYLPSFNKKLALKNLSTKKNFLIIGSAHSIKEVKIKEKQNVKIIFLSPIFKKYNNNKFLGVIKFNIISSKTNSKIVALGGINIINQKQLNMTKSIGIAGISFFKK